MRSSRCAWAAAPPSHSPKYFPHGNQNGPSRLRRPSSASSRALVARPRVAARGGPFALPSMRCSAFHAGHVFRGFLIHAFATACQVARPPCTDQTDTLGPRGLLLPGFQRIGRPPPLLDMTTTATGLLCWRDSHPLEWQLASLHQIVPWSTLCRAIIQPTMRLCLSHLCRSIHRTRTARLSALFFWRRFGRVQLRGSQGGNLRSGILVT